MILTLISLAELDGVFRGLYFFSRCGVSDGPELMEKINTGKVLTNTQDVSVLNSAYSH